MFSIGARSYLLVLFMDFAESASMGCGLNQYTLKINNGVRCMNCPQCDHGMGSVPQCGTFLYNENIVHCRECISGSSYSKSDSESSCMPCTVCMEHEVTVKRCTVVSNTVCGRCKTGYYRSFTHSCEQCAPCCDDDDIEPRCVEQDLSMNNSCRYTGRKCHRPTILAKRSTSVNLRSKEEQTTLIRKKQFTRVHAVLILTLAVLLVCSAILGMVWKCRQVRQRKGPVLTIMEEILQLPSTLDVNKSLDDYDTVSPIRTPLKRNRSSL